jgi:hypothetical protein
MFFPEELVKGRFSIYDEYRFACTETLGKPVSLLETPEKMSQVTFI